MVVDISGPVIAVINESNVVTDAEIVPVLQALQVQVSRDFAPSWGINARLVQVLKGGTIPKGCWQLIILDSSDQAGALGYHDLTSEDLPLGKVFAGTDIQYGNKWTVTASHELLEMLGDPDINLCAQIDDTTFYAYETADATEDDSLGYDINGVTVSDFVLPAWFQPNATGQVDFCNHLKKSLELAGGGYISVWTPNGGWQMQTAQKAPTIASRGPIGSRRERRRTPKAQWVRSTK